jgi:hypothetical protein
MSDQKAKKRLPPFPNRRPDIAIRSSKAKPFAVDCRELRWWFTIPEVGESGSAAWYDPPNWHLTSIQVRHAVRPARVHELDCVEMHVEEWPIQEPPPRGPAEWLMYGRLTEDKAQWLATLRLVNEKRVLYSFLDEGFEEDWGEAPRRLEDRGVYVRHQDGSLKQARRRASGGAIGAGVFRVEIADRWFTCLRVLDVEGKPSETGTLVEAYLNREGRTVLFRRYNGRLWAVGGGGGYDGPPWTERFPQHAQIVIDGHTYVHWYDCLTDVACNISSIARDK